jgi:predicted Zn-dependent protease
MTGRSPRLRAGCALLAVALGVAPLASAQSSTAPAAEPRPPESLRLPALGESASDEFNVSTEKRIGEQIMREIRRDPAYLDDPVLLDYLQSLWQPLVTAARARGDIDRDSEGVFPYEAFLVGDRSVNAFALPGGYVGVHLGLIGITASRDELASVLAHELSHVTQRHIARSVVAAQRSSTLSLAAMLLGILAASRASSADMAQAAIAGGQAAAAQAQLNFSRDMEREADRNGLGLMTQAGFAPGGMAAMFEKLDQANRLNDSGGFPYLRSHPLTVDRVGEARQRITSSGIPFAATGSAVRHALMQARARVLMDGSTQAMRRVQDTEARAGATPTARLAALYTRALASTRLRDFTLADEALAAGQPLLGDAVARQAWAQLSAESALARGSAPLAAQAYEGLPADGTRANLMLRAQLSLLTGDAAAPCGQRGLAPAVPDQRQARPAAALVARAGRSAVRDRQLLRRHGPAACRTGAGAQGRPGHRLHRGLGDRCAPARPAGAAAADAGRAARQPARTAGRSAGAVSAAGPTVQP